MKRYLLALAVAACVASPSVSAQNPAHAAAAQSGAGQAQVRGLTEHEARERLAEHGYTRINDLDFEGGVWRADARSADGNRVRVAMDPRDGRIYPDEQVAQLSKRDVRATLSAAGYTGVHDVDYKDGMWRAKAEDPGGRDVALKLDPQDGRIVGIDKD